MAKLLKKRLVQSRERKKRAPSRKERGQQTRKNGRGKRKRNEARKRSISRRVRQKISHILKNQSVFPPPAGFYHSTLEWIASQHPRPWYREIFSSHTCNLKPPIGLEEQVHSSFRWKQFVSPAPYVAEIPGGRVWGPVGAVIAPDNKLLWDASIHPPFVPHLHPIFRLNQMPPLLQLNETVAVLAFCSSDMHYHWCMDVLARAGLIHYSGVKVDRYIVNGVQQPFQWETLEAAGIPREKIMLCHWYLHVQARKLIVPIAPFIHWGPHDWQIQYLREVLMNQPRIQPDHHYSRVYISRSLAAHRKVENEDELLEVLRPLGFRCICLETLPVRRQIEIMSAARAVISPHGSGLTNLIFCRPGTKVIELFPSRFPVNIFWLLSNQLGLDYYFLFGEGERAGERIEPEHGYENIRIDVDKLRRILKLASLA